MDELSAVVAMHGEAVWRTAYRLLNHRDDALECYQDTFLAAVQLARERSVEHWRTMLVRIATRRAIDQLRRRYHGGQALGAMAQLVVEASTGKHEARLQAEELREQVRRALARLPPTQGEAFWLRHVEQLSVAEIAHELEIDAGHVRVLVHRAAAALRDLLGKTYGPATTRGETP